ncbi:MAG TPA: hypothetical protein VHD35_08065 [Chitinophagaceae bacterium]|nr:hypothetical protein [Chitinophagaceae bacterium]
MEVHHHPKIEKKGFKEYFLEFLMLFLAVTLGFFSENIREHFSEQKAVHQYLQTFSQELLRNKGILKNEKTFLTTQLPLIDSLANIFYEEKENLDLNRTLSLFHETIHIYTPGIETAAYQQMINAGGLKSINNIPLKDSLALYIDQVEKYKAFNQYLTNQVTNAFSDLAKIIDVREVLQDDPVIVKKPLSIQDIKDRRTIVFFFSAAQDQYLTDLRTISALEFLNDRLINIVNNQLKF